MVHIIKTQKKDTIILEPEKGYVMTDGNGRYSMHTSFHKSLPEPPFYTITEAEYLAIREAEATAEMERHNAN